MSRRANGEGSIYQRASDGIWVGAVSLQGGKRRVIYGRTQREVRQKVRELRAEVDEGVTAGAARVTVGAYLDTWLEVTLVAKVKAGEVKPRTYESYRDMVDLHISPHLGQRRLRELKAPDVRSWLSQLQDKQQTPRCGRCSTARRAPGIGNRCPAHVDVALPTLSSRTVSYAHAVLRSALSDAVNDQLVTRNVATLVAPPSQRRREVQPLNDAEAARLLAATATDTHRVLWITILALGLRRGEALALRWGDVDLAGRKVSIRRSLQRLRGDRDPLTGRRRGRLVELDPKTALSEADLPLPDMLVEILQDHRRQQHQSRIAAKAWADPGLIFTTAVGTALEPRNVDRAWKALCQRAGLRPLRIHDLRHATATFLLAEGVDLKVIQKTLRHSRHQTTADIYAHVAERLQRRAADSMNTVLRQLAANP